MRFGFCTGCRELKLLTKHSQVGGHKEGHGWVYLCRDCHNVVHNIKEKRKNLRFQKGSGGKFAKGTRRKK